MSTKVKVIRKRDIDDDDEDSEVIPQKPTDKIKLPLVGQKKEQSKSFSTGLSFNDDFDNDNSNETFFKVKKSKLSRNFKDSSHSTKQEFNDNVVPLTSIKDESSSSGQYSDDMLQQLKKSQQFIVPKKITEAAETEIEIEIHNNLKSSPLKTKSQKKVSFNMDIDNDDIQEEGNIINNITNKTLNKSNTSILKSSSSSNRNNNNNNINETEDMIIDDDSDFNIQQQQQVQVLSGDDAELLDQLRENEKNDTEDILYFNTPSKSNKKHTTTTTKAAASNAYDDFQNKNSQRVYMSSSSSSSSLANKKKTAADENRQNIYLETDDIWEAEIAARAGITNINMLNHTNKNTYDLLTSATTNRTTNSAATSASITNTNKITNTTSAANTHNNNISMNAYTNLSTAPTGLEFIELKKLLQNSLQLSQEAMNMLIQKQVKYEHEYELLIQEERGLDQKIIELQPIYNFLQVCGRIIIYYYLLYQYVYICVCMYVCMYIYISLGLCIFVYIFL